MKRSRWPALSVLLAAAAAAQPVPHVRPAKAEPGGVISVTVTGLSGPFDGGSASFAGQSSPLFVVRGTPTALLAAPAGAKAGIYTVRVTLGETVLSAPLTISKVTFPTQNIRMPRSKTGLMNSRLLARERAMLYPVFDERSPAPLWTGDFVVPTVGRRTSAWGRLRTVNGRSWGQHQGADIAAPVGTTVRATNAGRVVFAQRLSMRGNTVVLDHGLGVFSAYNHLDRIHVRVGQRVTRSQPIGSVGATGFVTGAHLHWELRIGRTPVNPWPVVKWGLPLG